MKSTVCVYLCVGNTPTAEKNYLVGDHFLGCEKNRSKIFKKQRSAAQGQPGVNPGSTWGQPVPPYLARRELSLIVEVIPVRVVYQIRRLSLHPGTDG